MVERNRVKQQNQMKPLEDPRLGDDLLWRELRVERFLHAVPALFLDRDGVIIEEKKYIRNPDDVELLPGIPELIRAARGLGMAVVEITNQAGIAHGYSDWFDFVRVEDRVTMLLAAAGVSVDAVLACPFHPQGQSSYNKSDHPWRKPNPGMLLEAGRLLNLALPRSILVGDKDIDQQAARNAELAFGIHVLTGHGREHETRARAVASENYPVHVVGDGRQAASLLGQALDVPTSRWSRGSN